MNYANESRSGGRFHRYDFDEMDAFDPITVEEELQRQAQYESTHEKSALMKRLHFKADGIPKTIRVEIEKEDAKPSSAACIIAFSSTDNTAATSSQRSASDSQLDESLNSFHRGGSFKKPRTWSLPDNQLVQSTSWSSSRRHSRSQSNHNHEATSKVPAAASLVEEVYACDPPRKMDRLDESLNSFHRGGSFKKPRTWSLPDNQLVQSTSWSSLRRHSRSQSNHNHEATSKVPAAASFVEEVYVCDPPRKMDMMHRCTHNRSTRFARTLNSDTPRELDTMRGCSTRSACTLNTRERKGGAINLVSHKSKHVNLPHESRNKPRGHSRTPERQWSSSQAMSHETRVPSNKTSHLNHLFARPTHSVVAGPIHSSRGVRRKDRPKDYSYHDRYKPNLCPTPIRRGTSADRRVHLNSLFSPSGPELTAPQVNRSLSTRGR